MSRHKGIIRKVIIGSEYGDNAMYFKVGNYINNGKVLIERIIKTAPYTYEMWVIEDDERKLWKTWEYMPITIENNLDFSEE